MADDYKINKFHGSIDEWIDAAGAGVEQVAEEFLIAVNNDIILRSPVDTGRFRGNWQVTLNDMPMHSVNLYSKTGQESIERGEAVIRGIFSGGAAVRSVHFSNLLIYANALEYGHSQQAPLGVLGLVSIRLRTYMNEAIIKARIRNGL
ncbi:MAG: hypothetical protein [Bacteriophage sp.]|nr:MAG: hypothetical protein [Bacteriophage sp.]